MLATFRIISLFLTLGSPLISAYSIYYVEDLCLPGVNDVTYLLETTNKKEPSIILRATRSFLYSPNIRCFVNIRQWDRTGIILSVRKIDFPSPLIYCRSYIRIYDESLSSPYTLCGYSIDSRESKVFYREGYLSFLYHTGNTTFFQSNSGFEVVATTYGNVPCRSDEFHCDNNRCIWKGLTCDGHNNCGDNSDEEFSACDIDIRPVPPGMIVGIACGVSGGILLLCAGIYCCIRDKAKKRAGRVVLGVSNVCPPQANPGIGTPYTPVAMQHPQPGPSPMDNPMYMNEPQYFNKPPPPPYSVH